MFPWEKGKRSNFKFNAFFWYVYYFFSHLKLIGLKGSSPLKIESGFTGHHVYCLSMTSGTNWMPLQVSKRLQIFFSLCVSTRNAPRDHQIKLCSFLPHSSPCYSFLESFVVIFVKCQQRAQFHVSDKGRCRAVLFKLLVPEYKLKLISVFSFMSCTGIRYSSTWDEKRNSPWALEVRSDPYMCIHHLQCHLPSSATSLPWWSARYQPQVASEILWNLAIPCCLPS